MIKGTIHKEDRHHKPLYTLTIKKQRYIKQKSEEIYGKEKYIIIDILTFLRIFYQGQKKISHHVINRTLVTDS